MDIKEKTIELLRGFFAGLNKESKLLKEPEVRSKLLETDFKFDKESERNFASMYSRYLTQYINNLPEMEEEDGEEFGEFNRIEEVTNKVEDVEIPVTPIQISEEVIAEVEEVEEGFKPLKNLDKSNKKTSKKPIRG